MVRSTTVLLIASWAAMLAVVTDAQCSMTLDEQFGGVGVYVDRRFKTNTQDCPSDWDSSIDRSECPKLALNAMIGDSTTGLLLQECQVACTDDDACKAVQYKSGGDSVDSICELFNVLPSYKLTKRSRGSRRSSIHPRHGDNCTLTTGPAEQPGDSNEVPCDADDIARFSVHAGFRRTSAWRSLGVKVDSAAACAALCVADGDACNAFETSSFTPNNDRNGNARATVTNCKRIAGNLPLDSDGAMTVNANYKAVTSSFRTFTLYDQNDNACN